MSNLSETDLLVDEVGRVLLAAADYIEAHGWCQGRVEDDAGNVCAIGGIDKACNGYWIRANTRERFRSYLGRGLISNWNNAPGRTKEEVVHALRSAAMVRP